jgi:hypothetical protein
MFDNLSDKLGFVALIIICVISFMMGRKKS